MSTHLKKKVNLQNTEEKFKATGPKNVLVEPQDREQFSICHTTGLIRNLPFYKEERCW